MPRAPKQASGKALLPGASVFPSFTPPPGATGNKGKVRLPPLDMATLKVERGVPLPARRAVRGESIYAPMLQRLSEPGMSVALPARYKAAVMTAARAWAKQRGGAFAMRLLSADECRLWRVA